MTNDIKILNKNKLPIKYVIKSYVLMENYPTAEDILFDLISDSEILNGLDFDYNYAKYILSIKLTKQKYDEFIKELINKQYVIENNIGKKNLYKVINHPWN